MKNAKKITRHQLEENIRDEIIYLGLVSAEADYKLSLIINSRFRISLRHSEPVMVDNGPRKVSFSRFSSVQAFQDLVFSLVSNKSEKDYLVKKLKNIDFIFCVSSPDNEVDAEKLASDLRNTESVTAVFVIDPETLKDRNIQYLTH